MSIDIDMLAPNRLKFIEKLTGYVLGKRFCFCALYVRACLIGRGVFAAGSLNLTGLFRRNLALVASLRGSSVKPDRSERD